MLFQLVTVRKLKSPQVCTVHKACARRTHEHLTAFTHMRTNAQRNNETYIIAYSQTPTHANAYKYAETNL